MKSLRFLTFIISITNAVMAMTVKDIAECPHIAPHTPPNDVHDLRADDIKVIAAMGDSVTAGMVAKNIDTPYVSKSQFIEYRGLSWVMGGDKGAPSIANLFKQFRPDLCGFSVGQRPARLCPDTFFCLDTYHNSSVDVLNAAQSGADSSGLPEQVEYLTQKIGLRTPFANTWKLINVFIGFNDAAISCLEGKSVEVYKANVKNSIEKLIENVDYAFINLVGIMHFNELIHLTDKIPGYKKTFENNSINLLDYECYCCRHPKGGLKFIGDSIVDYNKALAEIAEELSGSVFSDMVKPFVGKRKKQIAVVYQPMNPVISTVPVHSLSNLDGYHPNTVGYEYLSKALWNQMFLAKNEKLQTDYFDASRPIFCPSEHDRLKTYKKWM